MISFFKTTCPEGAAELLCKHYKHVLVHTARYLANRIPFRADMVQFDKIYFSRHGAEGSGQVGLWKEEGGLLLNSRSDYRNVEHDAVMFCEVPFSMAALHRETELTRFVSVLTQPTSWKQYEQEVFNRNPDADMCGLFYAILKPVITDEDICKLVGTTLNILPILRRATLRGVLSKVYYGITPITARVEPEDRGLMPMYHYIAQTLPETYLMKDNALHIVARNWKQQLRALVRCGSVDRKPKIGYYKMDEINPNFENIQKRHEEAMTRLKRIIEEVDYMPELNPQSLAQIARTQLSSHQSKCPPSSAPVPREAAAHAGDKDR